MILTDFNQRSIEWLKMRIGCVTASHMAKVMAKLKNGKPSEKRTQYCSEIICERLSCMATERYVTQYMEAGTENEPLAREAYVMAFDTEVTEVGLAMHDKIKWFAASPDGLVGDDGLLEIKCPRTVNHIEIVRTKVIPEEYRWQMLAQMSCTEKLWCDFVSYDPKLPPGLRLFVKRFDRDEARIAEMEQEVEKFLAEVEQVVKELEHGIPAEDLESKLVESLKAVEG